MKIAVAILILSLSSVSASTFGQRITLKESRTSLRSLLKKIEQQVPQQFVYDKLDIEGVYLQRVELHNVDLHDGMTALLKQTDLEFKIFGSHILLKKNIDHNVPLDAQQRIVRAIVRDEKGHPIQGVNVKYKEVPTISSSTNAQGEFSLQLPRLEGTLVFNHISFTVREIAVQELPAIVTLAAANQDLEEVLIVGYGTQKKINLTGAISSIGEKEIDSRPIRSVAAAMQGLMPGVTITNHTALPGQGAPSIRIRGINTLSEASPLFVIDGVPYPGKGSFDIINPADIENVTVLKDAASSAIYGVRGANGVVLISTKKGKNTNDRPSIGYSGYFGLQTPTALPKLLGSVDYMELLNEARVNANQSPTYTQEQIEIARSGSDQDYYASTNWIDEIYKPSAQQQNHNLNVSGAGNNINYYLSYGLLEEGGLITGDNYNATRHNTRLRLNTTLMDRLSIDANLGYIHRNYSGSAEGVDQGSGPLTAALSINPLVPVRFSNGSWGYHGGQRNPIAVTTDGGTNVFGSQEVTANLQANLRIIDGLYLRGQYALVYSNSKRNIFSKTINYYSPIDNSLIYQTNPVNKFDARDYTGQNQSVLFMADYEKTFKEKHYVKAMAAFSRDEYLTDNFTASRTDLPTQEGEGNLNLGTDNQLNTGDASQSALQSIFARVNYAFADRYLAEFNVRHDGSSRFIDNLRFETFWSGSLGWNFSEEPFLKFVKPIINLGKIRASYGELGNDQVGSFYPFRSIISPVSTQPLGNQITYAYKQQTVANELLKWESTKKQNIGMDLELLNHRLTFSGDYYVHETNNILLRIPTPDVFGVGTNYPPQNAGRVENRGWELQLGWRDKINEFNYSVRGNLSDVRNKVTYYGDILPTLGDQVHMVGQPISAFFGYVAQGIAQEADFDYDPATRVYTPRFAYDSQYPMMPGDLIFKDINNDGVINGDDRQVIGSNIPRYTYGLTASFDYKGLDFSFLLQGVGKADGLLTGSSRHAFINDGTYPQELHLDRWTVNNPSGSYPRLAYGYNYNQRLSTYWLEDASYLRLKNVQLGYTLPSRLTQQFRVNRLRLYASADNLFVRTDYFYGYDPETPVSGGGFYPQVKTFVFGLNINFN